MCIRDSPGALVSLECSRKQDFGSVPVNSEGTTATTTKNRMSSAETMNVGLRRRSCQASDHRLRGFPTSPVSGWAPTVKASIPRSSGAAVGCEGSVISDPRVENGVEQVQEQIGAQVDDDQD